MRKDSSGDKQGEKELSEKESSKSGEKKSSNSGRKSLARRETTLSSSLIESQFTAETPGTSTGSSSSQAQSQRLSLLDRAQGNADTPQVPKEYLCPIDDKVMDDPVLLIADGHSYNRNNIDKWLKEKKTSPTTNQDIDTSSPPLFVPNATLKSAIDSLMIMRRLV